MSACKSAQNAFLEALKARASFRMQFFVCILPLTKNLKIDLGFFYREYIFSGSVTSSDHSLARAGCTSREYPRIASLYTHLNWTPCSALLYDVKITAILSSNSDSTQQNHLHKLEPWTKNQHYFAHKEACPLPTNAMFTEYPFSRKWNSYFR